MIAYSFDFHSLKQWFQTEKRNLPWRENPSPYVVWVSEVMLQQTQVSTVIPYFNRWMKRFPTIHHLGAASLDEVIKLWEGLGYYSRARNLLEGARYVLDNHKGAIPQLPEELKKIKGLGPYTIGAIRSFAFHEKAAAVDGNVLRVMTRYFEIKEDITINKTVQGIYKLLEGILPDHEPWVLTEALIELGATVCQKTPHCGECPLRRSCKGHINGTAKDLPIKTKNSKITTLFRAVPVIVSGELWLVRRGEKGEIMHDLHEFPYFETTDTEITPEEIAAKIAESWSLDVRFAEVLEDVTHSYTRYRVRLRPVTFTSETATPVAGFQWLSVHDLDNLAFSSGHKKIFRMVKAFY